MPLDREDGTAAGEREAVLKQADLVAPGLAALHRVVGVDEFGKLRLALDARTLGQGIDIDGRHRKGPERVGPVGEKQGGRLESARPFGKARERSGGVIEDGEDGGADRAVFQKTERRLSEPRTQHAVLEREVRAERHARLDPVAVVLKAHPAMRPDLEEFPNGVLLKEGRPGVRREGRRGASAHESHKDAGKGFSFLLISPSSAGGPGGGGGVPRA